MKEIDNYQLTNAINKERKLAAIRTEVLTLPSEKALDLILDSSFPATLIQSFPDQDLHFLMHKIGEEDFLPVLALASSQQWEYILDVEVWRNDRLSMVEMTRHLSLLYRADPERFIRWAIKEKTEFIEYYLFRNMEIRIREHDEDSSDFGDDFSTIDSVFYFRFLDLAKSLDEPVLESEESQILKESEDGIMSDSEEEMGTEEEEYTDGMTPETTETLITNMLNTLADMDMSVFQGLLLESESVIPAETEEEEFRLKNVRLAEKGFLPPHEAVAIYQPLKMEKLRERPALFFKKPFWGSDLPLPPRYPSLILKKQSDLNRTSIMNSSSVVEHSSIKGRENLFVSALDLLDKDANIALNLQSEFAFLVNSVVSADKQIVRSPEELEKIVEKACCYLSLGLEIIYLDLLGEKSLSGEKGGLPGEKRALNGKIDQLQLSGDGDLTPELGAEILRKYAIKDIFRVGSAAGMALKERVQSWYGQSYIVKQGLSLTFLGENWLGIVGGLLLNRPLFFDNYTTGVLYRPFASLEDIVQTSTALTSIAIIDKMVARLNLNHALLSRRFLTWKSLFLTLWAMNRMGIDSSSGYSMPLEKFKPFFVQMLNLRDGKPATEGEPGRFGKIDQVIRNDFFTWLSEENVLQRSGDAKVLSDDTISATARIIFDQAFDELEEEYGTVSPEDIDSELITQFIITQG